MYFSRASKSSLLWPLSGCISKSCSWPSHDWRNFTNLASSTQQVDVEHRNTFASRYIDCPHNYVVGFLRLCEWNVCLRKALRCTQLTRQRSRYFAGEIRTLFSVVRTTSKVWLDQFTCWEKSGSEKSIALVTVFVKTFKDTIRLVLCVQQWRWITKTLIFTKSIYKLSYCL